MKRAFCNNCKNIVYANDWEYTIKCPHCGAEVDVALSPKMESFTPTEVHNNNKTKVDDGGFLWGLLGFLFPVVGLILYLVWKDEYPNRASSVGAGAIVAVVIGVIAGIIGGIISAILTRQAISSLYY